MSNRKYGITLNSVTHEVIVAPQGSDYYNISVDGELFSVSAITLELESIESHILGLNETTFIYTGEEIRPSVITDDTVLEGLDYSLIYSNNIEIGTGSVTILGEGNYTGTVSLDFTITASEKSEESIPNESEVSTNTESDTSTDNSIESDDENVTIEENLEASSNNEDIPIDESSTDNAS